MKNEAMEEKEREERGRLPEAFVKKMEELLGEEAKPFFKSYESERKFGLRLNPAKVPKEAARERLTPIPWTAEGYYYDGAMRPGKHPYHEAGLYYIQEPSAMAVAEALKPMPGERILDLCAAPGGKSTHAAGKLGEKGLLVCNEIHPARAKILSQNVERMGIGNALVTNMEPAGLIPAFPEFFDGIIVDAPCSGEGMFRKDEDAAGEWSPAHVTLCAQRQDMILDCAAKMLKPGGRLVYSTCTFSPEENEQTVARFLCRHEDFSLVRPDCADFFSPGRPEWAAGFDLDDLSKTVRIWPHKTEGEGHFVALLQKAGEERRGQEKKAADKRQKGGKKGPDCRAILEAFFSETLTDSSRITAGRRPLLFGDHIYLIPEEAPELSGLKVLRPGLHVGTIKKDRFEPSHALALFLKTGEAKQTAEIGSGALAERYLRGETLPGAKKGWTLMTVDGYPIGWGKASGGMIKNHYPKGIRRM